MNVKKNILKSCYIPDQFIFIYLLFTCIYHKTSGYFILKFSTAFNNIRHFKLELQTNRWFQTIFFIWSDFNILQRMQ